MNTEFHDRVLELAKSEDVRTPNTVPVTKEGVMLVAASTGLGARIAGIPGAVIGGTIGWAADAVRRRLLRRKRR